MSGETTKTRPVTRSMSGTKKTGSKIVVNAEQKAAKRASNKAKSGTTKIIRTPGILNWTWKDEAYSFFIKEYKEIHYKRPPSATGKIIPKELRLAIVQAWSGMSDREKAPYIERAEKFEAERVRAEKMADEMRAKGLL
ncbi:hypothetical protein OROHE_005444 [Orobanche hederae]